MEETKTILDLPVDALESRQSPADTISVYCGAETAVGAPVTGQHQAGDTYLEHGEATLADDEDATLVVDDADGITGDVGTITGASRNDDAFALAGDADAMAGALTAVARTPQMTGGGDGFTDCDECEDGDGEDDDGSDDVGGGEVNYGNIDVGNFGDSDDGVDDFDFDDWIGGTLRLSLSLSLSLSLCLCVCARTCFRGRECTVVCMCVFLKESFCPPSVACRVSSRLPPA